MNQRCAHCGDVIDRPNAGLDSPARLRLGRPPRYCSNACKTRAYRARNAAASGDAASVSGLVTAMRDALARVERHAVSISLDSITADPVRVDETREAVRGDLTVLISNARELRRLLLAADDA
jgi:hypothetical protein